LLLAIPTFTVLLPVFLSYPLKVPVVLVLPHLIYTVVFIAAIVISAAGMLKQLRNKSQRSITEETKVRPPKQAAGADCRE
jgi:hypothetical protein